jgi:hypothetical protein
MENGIATNLISKSPRRRLTEKFRKKSVDKPSAIRIIKVGVGVGSAAPFFMR